MKKFITTNKGTTPCLLGKGMKILKKIQQKVNFNTLLAKRGFLLAKKL